MIPIQCTTPKVPVNHQYVATVFYNELFILVPDTNDKAWVLSNYQKDIDANAIIVIAAEIHVAILELPSNKAPGYDGLILEDFKFASHQWEFN